MTEQEQIVVPINELRFEYYNFTGRKIAFYGQIPAERPPLWTSESDGAIPMSPPQRITVNVRRLERVEYADPDMGIETSFSVQLHPGLPRVNSEIREAWGRVKTLAKGKEATLHLIIVTPEVADLIGLLLHQSPDQNLRGTQFSELQWMIGFPANVAIVTLPVKETDLVRSQTNPTTVIGYRDFPFIYIQEGYLADPNKHASRNADDDKGKEDGDTKMND